MSKTKMICIAKSKSKHAPKNAEMPTFQSCYHFKNREVQLANLDEDEIICKLDVGMSFELNLG